MEPIKPAPPVTRMLESARKGNSFLFGGEIEWMDPRFFHRFSGRLRTQLGVQSEKQVGTGAVRKKRFQVFLPGVGRKGVAFADFGRGKMTAGGPGCPARSGFARNLVDRDGAFDMVVFPCKAGTFGRETGPGHLAVIDIVVDAACERRKGRFFFGE